MAGLRLVKLVPSRRFERPTCPLGGGRSIQLSYEGGGGIFAWNARLCCSPWLAPKELSSVAGGSWRSQGVLQVRGLRKVTENQIKSDPTPTLPCKQGRERGLLPLRCR